MLPEVTVGILEKRHDYFELVVSHRAQFAALLAASFDEMDLEMRFWTFLRLDQGCNHVVQQRSKADAQRSTNAARKGAVTSSGSHE